MSAPTSTTRPIVVAIDFTQCSLVALAEAARLARPFGTQVEAVHAIDDLVVTDLSEAIAQDAATIREQLQSDAHAEWPRFAGELASRDGIPLAVLLDHPIAAVIRHAAERGAQLLVLGAASGNPDDEHVRVGAGTFASACVRKSSVDTLLVRSDRTGPHRRIVAAIDFSPTSLRALERAAQVAQADGARLTALHVFSPPWRRLHYRAPTPESSPSFQQQYRSALDRRLAEACAAVLKPFALKEVRHVVREHGTIRTGLVETAAELEADLIALGTRGRSTLRDLLLGSTAEKVLRDTTCSILAVKPSA